MNIFHLHRDPKICAKYHCDKHVVKMVLETAQMLSTAYQQICEIDTDLYKIAYPKHPMTIWVSKSENNFKYALSLGSWLAYQYRLRYNKKHKSQEIIDVISNEKLNNFIDNVQHVEFTPPPLCMPEQYKVSNYIESYRYYYKKKKKRFARYTGVDTPDFML